MYKGIRMKPQNKKSSIAAELDQLESDLVSLIDRRARLLSNISRKRQERRDSFTDTQLEKELWKKWKPSAQTGNKRYYRQIFNQLNTLAYAQAEKSPEKPFCLYPSHKPLNVDIPGPRETVETRLYTLLAAHSPGIRTIHDYPLNDVHVEFIKALNQGKAKLSWEQDTLHSQESEFELDGASIYVGEDKLNLFLLLALGAGQPCVVRFNCSARLKNEDLRSIMPALQQLGARLNFIEPQSYSLPARLESSGIFSSSINFPPDGDPMFLLALILAAGTYPRPVEINFSPEQMPPQTLHCLNIMEKCGISSTYTPGKINIEPGPITVPHHPEIHIDPFLSGFLLAMPVYGDGSVRLSGSWPECPSVLDLLHHGGIETEIREDAITARRGEAPKDTVLDIRQSPELLPLAVSIIAGLMRQNREEGSIFVDTADTDVTSAQECLENAGLSCRVFPNRLEVSRSTSSQEKGPPWECPTPWWCLAYALISFSYRGLCLSNPGILTSVWPKFWKIFTSLPEPQNQFESLESKGNEKTKRRRIIVR
jgi:3-phosphoshikimate 1-carboxyvinyltransferase